MYNQTTSKHRCSMIRRKSEINLKYLNIYSRWNQNDTKEDDSIHGTYTEIWGVTADAGPDPLLWYEPCIGCYFHLLWVVLGWIYWSWVVWICFMFNGFLRWHMWLEVRFQHPHVRAGRGLAYDDVQRRYYDYYSSSACQCALHTYIYIYIHAYRCPCAI